MSTVLAFHTKQAISDTQWAQEPTEIAYNFNLYTYTFNMYPYC
jgi:hypothetical protein